MLQFQYGKGKTEVCFPWSANDGNNRRLLFQQMCPSLQIAVLSKVSGGGNTNFQEALEKFL